MGAAAKKIAPPKSRLFGAGAAIIQPSLKVGKSGDKYEKEADSVADQVMMMPSTPQTPIMTGSAGGVQLEEEEEAVQPKSEEEESVQMMPLSAGISMISLSPEEEEELQLKEEEEETVQLKGEEEEESLQMMGGNGDVPASVSTQIQGGTGGGSPMSPAVQSEMGKKIGADFSGVKIHTGPQATSMSNALGAQAFTHGSDVYFNEGKYSPESSKGKHLLAHELTHVVQQDSAVRRSPSENISEGAEGVQRLPWAVREGLSEFASYIPGYTLLCVVVGYDPLAGRSVERNAVNLIGGLMGLIPIFGTLLFNKLQELGIIQDALTWVQDQMDSLDLSTGRIERVLEQAWDEVSLLSGWDANMEVLDRTFGQLYRDIETFAGRVKDKVFELIKEALMTALKALADSFPGYPLLVQLLGHDPLTGEEVNSTTAEKIEAFLLLIGKEQELERMQAEGTIQETADWIDAELAALNFSFEEVKSLFDQAWNAFSLDDLRDPPAAFTRTVAIFAPFTQRVFTFAENVATKVLEFIKNALLAQISAYAREQQGYHLVTVLLGKDPFTEEEVPRTTENIIRGFMGLMPGGEEQFQQMKETGAIEQTVSRIDAAVATLNFSWAYITGLFLDLWNSFTIEDVFHPIDAFVRIVQTLADPIQRLFAFIVTIVKIIVEVLLVVMNFPIETVQQIIANARSAFEDIKRDPIGFLKNLLRAVKQGFVQFFDNIVTHLLGGLRDWLFGELASAGINPPADLSFQSILGFVLDVLGISMDNVWERLALKIGPERVEQIRGAIDTLTGIWTFIKDVWERGPIAIWEYIQEQMSNLWNMVLEQVQSWIMTRIIEQITVRLLSMLDPTGIMAVVNSFIAFYRAVQSFIEKLREMLEIVNSFVAGVANIARGTIAEAANFLEGALARAVPVAIGFLANQVGLRGLGTRIAEMIGGLREKVNEAIDWLIDRALSVGGAILQAGRNAVDTVMGWLGMKKEFTLPNGEKHEAYFESPDPQARLIIASADPKTIQQIIASKTWNGKTIPDDKVAELQTSASTIDQNREGQGVEKGQIIMREFEKIVAILNNIGGPPIPRTALVTNQKVTGAGMEMGKHVIVSPLSLDPGGLAGSQPTYTTGLGALLKQNYPNYIVEGHLLNHKLHGPGNVSWNLTPIAKQTNSEMNSKFERFAKQHILDEGKVVKYEVEVEYSKNLDNSIYSDPDQYVAQSLNFSLTELEYKNNNWTPAPSQPTNWDIPPSISHAKSSIPGFGTGRLNFMVNLNTSDVRAIQRIKGIGQTRAEAIVNYRESKASKRINSYSELEAAPGIGTTTVEKLRDEPMARLRS
jgi:competence ComEA-like helix-hairpin-helix protein